MCSPNISIRNAHLLILLFQTHDRTYRTSGVECESCPCPCENYKKKQKIISLATRRMYEKSPEGVTQPSGLLLRSKTSLFANFAHYGDDFLKEIQDRRGGVPFRAIWWRRGELNPCPKIHSCNFLRA